MRVKLRNEVDRRIKSKVHFSAHDLMPFVNQQLLPNRRRGDYSDRTVRLWLVEEGYEFGNNGKN